MAPSLAATHRLILPDQMGHGKSGRIRRRYGLMDYALDLLGLLDHLGIEKAAVGGFSMGALVAQKFYATWPERVTRLVLIAPPPPYRLRWKLGIEFVSLLERTGLTSLKKETIKALARRTARGRDKTFIEKSFQSLDAYEDREFAYILKSVWERGMDPDPGRVPVPTLILVGERDGIRAHSRVLAERLPGSRLRVIPEADHALLIDRPVEVAREIQDFLGQGQ